MSVFIYESMMIIDDDEFKTKSVSLISPLKVKII